METLALHVLHIEHIGLWTLIPVVIAVGAGLYLTVHWILRETPSD